MDEFDATGSAGTIFQDSTSQAVPLSVSLGHYFTSNGTAEIATSHGLVTGLTPITFPTVSSNAPSLARIGYLASVPIFVNDTSQGGIVRFPSLTIVASFGRYNSSSETPFAFNAGTTTYTTPINIPSGLNTGNFNLTILVGSWQLLDSEAQEWIPLNPASFNETLTLTNNPIPPTNPGSNPPSNGPGPSTKTHSTATSITLAGIIGSIIIPVGIGYGVLALLAAFLLIRESRKPHHRSGQSQERCRGCGAEIVRGILFCPICGLNQQPPGPVITLSVDPAGTV